MQDTNIDTVSGWFAGRIPDGWFAGPPQVTQEDDQIVVVGELAAPSLPGESGPDVVAGAAQGRIARFREETRRHRIWIAREAEHLFKVNVRWGARVGDQRILFNKGGGGREGGSEKPAGVEVGLPPFFRRGFRFRGGQGFGPGRGFGAGRGRRPFSGPFERF